MLIHPLFICISGPTSSGKSTVALGLKDFLENQQTQHGLENLEVNLLNLLEIPKEGIAAKNSRKEGAWPKGKQRPRTPRGRA